VLSKDLVIVDPETGVQDSCGTIVKRRFLGSTPVWLTYDDSQAMWWIVWKDARVRKIGYRDARRLTCWDSFAKLAVKDLAALRPA
jgi:hypothetical protein